MILDGVTFLPMGGETNESVVLFKAITESGDLGQLSRIHIEVREESEPFTSIPTASSHWVASGMEVEVVSGNFETGKSYHWQAWAEDFNRVHSTPIEFGGTPDFVKVLNSPAMTPLSPQQYQLNGVIIPVGGTTASQGVILKALAEDPEGDLVSFQVEIQPLGNPFAGAFK